MHARKPSVKMYVVISVINSVPQSETQIVTNINFYPIKFTNTFKDKMYFCMIKNNHDFQFQHDNAYVLSLYSYCVRFMTKAINAFHILQVLIKNLV